MADGYVETTSTNPVSNQEGWVVRQVGISSAEAAADGLANPTAVQTMTHGLVWNGATWDRARGNIDGTALAIAARTAGTVEGADIINYEHRGAHVIFHYSVGQAVFVMRIQGKDELSDTYYTLLTTASMSATGSPAFIIYPGVSAGPATAPATGGQRSEALPRTWRVTVVPSGSPTATYGIGYSLIK